MWRPLVGAGCLAVTLMDSVSPHQHHNCHSPHTLPHCLTWVLVPGMQARVLAHQAPYQLNCLPGSSNRIFRFAFEPPPSCFQPFDRVCGYFLSASIVLLKSLKTIQRIHHASFRRLSSILILGVLIQSTRLMASHAGLSGASPA